MQTLIQTNNEITQVGKRKGILFSIYFLIMLVSYSAYVLLDHYRLSRSELWLSKSSLSTEDAASIAQVGQWTANFEAIFITLFIAMSVFCLMRSRQDRKVLKQFLVVNMFLFTGVVVLGSLLYVFKPLPVYLPDFPIGNVLQPLFIPIFIIGGLLIYLFWVSRKKRSRQDNGLLYKL